MMDAGVVKFMSCWFRLDFPKASINTTLVKALSLANINRFI